VIKKEFFSALFLSKQSDNTDQLPSEDPEFAKTVRPIGLMSLVSFGCISNIGPNARPRLLTTTTLHVHAHARFHG
jgi:hypothetical protein